MQPTYSIRKVTIPMLADPPVTPILSDILELGDCLPIAIQTPGDWPQNDQATLTLLGAFTADGVFAPLSDSADTAFPSFYPGAGAYCPVPSPALFEGIRFLQILSDTQQSADLELTLILRNPA